MQGKNKKCYNFNRWGSGSACRSLHGGIVEWTGVCQDILSAETKPS